MKPFLLSLLLTLTLSSFSSHALEPFTPTPSEMASLPPFCKAKMVSGEGSADYKLWQGTLGPDFLHTHHYCAGINYISRYHRARSRQDKQYNLNNALTNLEYMARHAAPTYSLMPDVYLNLGVVNSLLNKTGVAITHFNKAIELNPRQPRAYNALADYYLKTKQSAKAMDIIVQGLRYNPDTRSLQRRYTDMGGKKPYPAPIVDTPEQVAAPAATAPAAGAEAAATTPASSGPADAGVASTPPAAAAPETFPTPKIGSPTNPYCRFCPD